MHVIKLKNPCFINFKSNLNGIDLPTKFTFPFYYEPHLLCKLAAEELQTFLENQTWEHNFGLNNSEKETAIGKMFGVLVVKNKDNKLGYLTAYSGKLIGKNEDGLFVPPVFDIFSKNGFFIKEEKIISSISTNISQKENNTIFKKYIKDLNTLKNKIKEDLNTEKTKLKQRKKIRKEKRQAIKNLQNNSLAQEVLVQQSLHDKYYFKELSTYYEQKLNKLKTKVTLLNNEIELLKKERKTKSDYLQQYIFNQYHFLNKNKEQKSLIAIFKELSNKNPIAGTGNCAAPKLLQYAFQHDLKPLAMAEFWWGKPLDSAIRKHKQFYPACRGKCEPILNYMLKGIVMDENPILKNLAKDKKIKIVYEDEHLVVINKPTELLSVPGKNITDSVYTRMQLKYPTATGPLLVHRLDMSTSGLLLIAKTKKIHKKLQSQFIKRTIKKQYVALLDGILPFNKGIIDLPLRVNLNNRPKQLVCYDYGKPAKTKWEVIAIKNQQTRIAFYPITGRTHQLRVHAAHHLGLNTPIVGDDLYGAKDKRLCLHAASLEFKHPVSKEIIVVKVAIPF